MSYFVTQVEKLFKNKDTTIYLGTGEVFYNIDKDMVDRIYYDRKTRTVQVEINDGIRPFYLEIESVYKKPTDTHNWLKFADDDSDYYIKG